MVHSRRLPFKRDGEIFEARDLGHDVPGNAVRPNKVGHVVSSVRALPARRLVARGSEQGERKVGRVSALTPSALFARTGVDADLRPDLRVWNRLSAQRRASVVMQRTKPEHVG